MDHASALMVAFVVAAVIALVATVGEAVEALLSGVAL